MTSTTAINFRPIYWNDSDNTVRLIDQTRLPSEEVWLELKDYREVVAAIRDMKIRGAPAIGVAGAYGMALAAIEFWGSGVDNPLRKLEAAALEIELARPTGANLAWAVRRMVDAARNASVEVGVVDLLIAEAKRIQHEDEESNRKMGRFGAELIAPGTTILTHCNTGALATGGYGTALGVIRTAWSDGKLTRVFATETRPFLQGARLTAWELVKANIDATLIPDSAAGHLMKRGRLQAVIVGADRITANGDVANKIGTYTLAVLAKENGVPFYVAAPTSTIDMSLQSGEDIQIEERPGYEVTSIGGVQIAPTGIEALNIAFDVTPHEYVTAIITDKGVVREPYMEGIRQMMETKSA